MGLVKIRYTNRWVQTPPIGAGMPLSFNSIPIVLGEAPSNARSKIFRTVSADSGSISSFQHRLPVGSTTAILRYPKGAVGLT